MKKQRTKILLSTLIIIIIISSFALVRNTKAMNTEEIVEEVSLLNKQNEIANKIKNEISSKRQVYLDPYDIAPLSALITFKTTDKVSSKITVKGQNGSDDLVNSFDEASEHYVPVFGLYPDTDNLVILEYGDLKEEFIIKTDKLPSDFSIPLETYINEDYKHILNDEFYFVTPASKGYTGAYDINGNVRWYLSENLVWEIRYLNNGNLVLSNEKVINPPYYTTGFYELSMLGKIEKEYITPGGYHHDLAELPNGNFLVASDKFEHNTVEDFLVEIDRNSGEIVKEIDLKNILEVDGGKSENWIDFDWFHNNSVYYDEKTNSITLSGRHQDSVVNLDYETLEINYIVGDSNEYSEDFKKNFLTPTENTEMPYAQHAAKILPNGNLFVFDNGINRSKYYSEYLSASENYSRGVIYSIDEENRTVSQVFEYGKDRGNEYFSSYVSDVDYLADNHYLIHSGGVAFNNGEVLNSPPGLNEFTDLRSYTSEVYNDELIFELLLPNNFYRAEKMSIYNKSTYENMDDGVSLGSLDTVDYDKKSLSLFKPIINDPEFLESYDLDVKLDEDRLIVSGNFKKEDKVKVVLYNNLSTLEYKIRISERPYTAMCIVIFDDQKQSVSKYINKSEDLESYTVLIEINNKLYTSNKKVDLSK